MKTEKNSTHKILYVDDEEAWRVVFKRNIGELFEVITAKSADEGWALLKKHSKEIAMIVSDQRMPGRPGIELLKQARAYYPRIIRILTTGFSDSTIAVNATNQGAVYHYVSKPWNSEELVSILKRAMDFHLIREERDNLMGRKLSSIQRKILESKLQCLLVFGAARNRDMKRSTEALNSYLQSVTNDPGQIFDLKSIYRNSQSEFTSLTRNLALVEKLMEVPDQLLDAKSEKTISVAKILLTLRDCYPQVIFSIFKPCSNKKNKLTSEESLLSAYLLDLISNWMEPDKGKKFLEISEKPLGSNAIGKQFYIRIGYFNDPVPYLSKDDRTLFNGINLDEEKELAWLKFLLAIHHMGGCIIPDILSAERLSFSIFDVESTRIDSKLSADSVIADLLRKFEGWNYSA